MPSPALTHEILVTLGIALAALVLFVTDRLPMELVGMLVMVALILSGVITPAEGVSGFSNEAVVTIAAMFVLSGALIRTGAVDELGRWISRLSGESGFRLLLVSIAVIIPASAFLNNTPVVIVMVPILLGLARERGIPASRLLMPASFASQMGGTLTLIGTSTNLLVAGLVLDTEVQERYELGEYLSGLEFAEDSPLVGQTLEETGLREEFGLDVVAIMLAASNSFMTPVGYQTNTFIYGPGGYRFSDFARVGGPLALLFAFASAFVIPFFFPF